MDTVGLGQAIGFRQVGGPKVEPVVPEADCPTMIGRGYTCRVKLDDPAVSRKHAMLTRIAGQWFVADQGSRHGTYVNGVKLGPRSPAPLAHGDHLTIGPWVFEVALGRGGSTVSTHDDTIASRGLLEPLSAHDLGSLASVRLGALMDCAERMQAAADEAELARTVVDAALGGTAFGRALLVRPGPDFESVEVLASVSLDAPDVGADQGGVSRTLLGAAAAGHVVRLADRPELKEAMSIAERGIESALCAPVQIGKAVGAYLYLDDVGANAMPRGDAAAYCAALARICGLAMGNLQRADLLGRKALVDAQFEAAQAVQRRLLPPKRGEHGPLRYAMRCLPGQVVAGDLFDICTLPDGRVAFFLGDVVGKGLGPALIMATVQTQLRMILRDEEEPARALGLLNEDLHRWTGAAEFVTLWLGVFDPASGLLRCADAGHGHAVSVPSGRAGVRLAVRGGPPLGIDGSFAYEQEAVRLDAGDRVLLFSDGVIEQRSDGGEEFGLERVLANLDSNADPDADVGSIVGSLRSFAGDTEQADDVTVASILHGAP
jgi:serine phosphatase RsbU (regulator of sigma subunit)